MCLPKNTLCVGLTTDDVGSVTGQITETNFRAEGTDTA